MAHSYAFFTMSLIFRFMLPTYSGMNPKCGYIPPEWVVPFKRKQVGLSSRNGWVLSSGMGWDFAPEYAV